MTIALERRLANFRAATAGASSPRDVERSRGPAIGAERLAAEVDGELVRNQSGCFVRVERRSTVIPIDRDRLASLPGQPPPSAPLICLDTETTGLATAAGTLAFLVGLGWWEGAQFRQVQLLLPDHVDEPALLDELRRHIPADAWLVTYNGKGFDWPLLVARYRMARDGPPAHAGHLDLLAVVRRLFRHRMPDARLQTAETQLLGLRRRDDVPGWEIPARYLQFLRDGEPARLIEIVRHNDEDVRSLARILALVDAGFGDPEARRRADPGDLAGLARSFAGAGRFEEALGCLDAAILTAADLPGSAPADPPIRLVRDEADDWWSPRRRPDFGGRIGRSASSSVWRSVSVDRLDGQWTSVRLVAERARMLRRLGRYRDAEAAWINVADAGGTLGALAWIEIAKLREHRRRDLEAALAATLAALRLIERARLVGRSTGRLDRDLARRATRLRHRISRRASHRNGRPSLPASTGGPTPPEGPAS
ncbi:MAG: ribonuclease H-like domain-containing protein [Chloroflexi bacterium]|nr:ribonuclease H-like domain-containing protein [Chloroflexota bacterium]